MQPQTTPREADPAEILVVANQTACSEELLRVIDARMQQGPCRFTLLVPATPPAEHATWTEGEAKVLATHRMEDALTRFGDLGADTAEGIVGDAHPVQAIDDAMRGARFDEIILSTLPPGISRWLKLDLQRRVEQRFARPTTTVISQRHPVS